jgi:hypothetical protein
MIQVQSGLFTTLLLVRHSGHSTSPKRLPLHAGCASSEATLCLFGSRRICALRGQILSLSSAIINVYTFGDPANLTESEMGELA